MNISEFFPDKNQKMNLELENIFWGYRTEMIINLLLFVTVWLSKFKKKEEENEIES